MALMFRNVQVLLKSGPSPIPKKQIKKKKNCDLPPFCELSFPILGVRLPPPLLLLLAVFGGRDICPLFGVK